MIEENNIPEFIKGRFEKDGEDKVIFISDPDGPYTFYREPNTMGDRFKEIYEKGIKDYIKFIEPTPSAFDGSHYFPLHKPRTPQDGRFPGETSAEFYLRLAQEMHSTTGILCKSEDEAKDLFKELGEVIKDQSSRRNFLIIGGGHPGKSGLSFLTAQTGRPIILNLEQDQDELKEKLQALMEMEPYKPVYINPDLEVGIKDIHTSNQPFYKNVGKKGGNKNRKGGRKF